MNLTNKAITYLLSNIINASIPFLLLPLLTRVLTPSEYGEVALFQSLVIGLGAIIGVNTVGSANRKYYDDDIKNHELARYNGSCIQILIVSTLFTLLLLLPLYESLAFYLSISPKWIFSSVIVSVGVYLIQFRLGQWQIRGKASRFGIYQILTSFLNMGLSVLFVVAFNFGAQGRIDGQLYAVLFVSLLGIISLFKDKLVTLTVVDYKFIKEALKFGIPLIPHVFGAFLLSSVDRFVISRELGLSQAGTYMVVAQVGMVLALLFDAINKAYVPWLFDILKRDCIKEKGLLVKNTYLYFIFLLSISPIFFLLGPKFITLFAGANYKVSGTLIGLICLGQIFGGMYLMVTNYLFYHKKTGTLSIVTIGVGVLNLLLILILIQPYNLVGVALAFVISKFFQFILTWWLAYKVSDIPWVK
ncbi:lipopolysaccharide biosynthesis protein [Vibrio astriarenae]